MQQSENRKVVEKCERTCRDSRRIWAERRWRMRRWLQRCWCTLAVWCRVSGRAVVDIRRCTGRLSAVPSTTRSPCAAHRRTGTSRRTDCDGRPCSRRSWWVERHSAAFAAGRWRGVLACRTRPAPVSQSTVSTTIRYISNTYYTPLLHNRRVTPLSISEKSEWQGGKEMIMRSVIAGTQWATVADYTHVGQKSGPFLQVYNSCMWRHIKAFNCSALYREWGWYFEYHRF